MIHVPVELLLFVTSCLAFKTSLLVLIQSLYILAWISARDYAVSLLSEGTDLIQKFQAPN